MSSCARPLLSVADGQLNKGRGEQRISIRLAASVPFSLSAAGNLPRNVTAAL